MSGHITVISGGSASRGLAGELAQLTEQTSHILPVFDDGGSSGAIRAHFNIVPPGDLRNRLLALADPAHSGHQAVTQLFEKRLSSRGTQPQLTNEVKEIVRGQTPEIAAVTSDARRLIVTYLSAFLQRSTSAFDLRGANIGNLVLTGGLFTEDDINVVLAKIADVIGMRGRVLPVCTAGEFHLQAVCSDSAVIVGQAAISRQAHKPIQDLSLVLKQGTQWVVGTPPIGKAVPEAIQCSSLLVYAMGSFYTSIVPNLIVAGMGEQIRTAQCNKVLIINLRRDFETQNMSASELVTELYRYATRTDPAPGPLADYVQTVIVDDHGLDCSDRRLPIDIDQLERLGLRLIVCPLEQHTDSGLLVHDAAAVAKQLITLSR